MAQLQWYLTRYARLSNGEFELISYAPMPNLAVAQHRAQTTLPDNEFYKAECTVGSLIRPSHTTSIPARQKYSHKPHVAVMQTEAEVKAQHILDTISHKDFDVQLVFADMRMLKPLLTKPQYDTLMDALLHNRCILKAIY